MTQVSLEASRKAKFDMLFGLLKEHYAGLIDFEFKHGTVLTLLLGWRWPRTTLVAFSQSPRSLRDSFAREFSSMQPSTPFGFAVSIAGHFLHYKQLRQLRYMPTEYFEKRRIQPFTSISFVILNWVVALLISIVILLPW